MKYYFHCSLLFLCFAFSSFAQTAKVSGIILASADNEPVIGASVTLKDNPTMGTVSDLDGNFTLNVPENSKFLIVSYLGMKTVEVPIIAWMNIVLQEDEQILDEVVITGYQRIDRRLFSGAASIIRAENARIDGVADVSKMLQGRVAGLQLTNVSGTFGTSPKLQIRGATSIFGNSSPLWVVDGVILDEIIPISAADLSSGNAITLIGSTVAGLNAEDIESFQILKDASATAIYGSRSMNGVIVITTKRGKKGTTSMNYTGEFTIRSIPNYSQFDIMNSQDQMAVFLELESNGALGLEYPYRGVTGSAQWFLAKNGGVFTQWYQMTDQRDENGNYLADNTLAAKTAYLRQAELRNTDWFKELFRPSLQQQHSVAISSGSEKSTNYMSFSYLGDPGWTVADKVNRFTLNGSSNYKISPKLSLGLLGNASIRAQKAPGTLNRKTNVVEGEYSRDFDINPFSYALNTSRTMDANEFYRRNYADFNIKHELANNYIDLSALDTKMQMDLSYQPIAGLELNALASVRYAKTSQEHRILNTSNMAEAYRAVQSTLVQENNNFLWQDPDYLDALPVVVMGKGGFYNTKDVDLFNYYGRVTANYIRSFEEEKHIINILTGVEVRNTDRTNRFSDGFGYLWGSDIAVTDYRLLRKILDQGDAYFGMAQTYDRQAGFFGTGTYSYQGTYTLNTTLRTEGTNQMGNSRTARWLPTWNISGAWNLMNELFMKKQKLLSFLTLRGTYGLTANMAPLAQAKAIYNAMSTFRPFQEDREVMLYIQSLQNDELTWEKMYESNIGLDMGFLQNRFNINFDMYWRNCFDLIGPIRTSGLGGEHIKLANVADMKSRGFELAIKTHNIKQNKFNWHTNLIFSYNTNQITKMNSESNVMDLVGGIKGAPKTGYAQSGLYSIPFAGLNEKGHPTYWDENGERVQYINFQNSLNTDFLHYEGQIDPKYMGGIENTFSYRNWRFSFFLNYQGGNVIRLNPAFSATYSDTDAMTKSLNNRWFKPGDEAYTTIPSLTSVYELLDMNYTTYNAYNFSTERVAKGDFIRLRDITLSYDFNKEWIKKMGFSSLQMRGVASNLWLIYSDKKLNGQDPEFVQSGGVAMPVPRQFTLSLRAGF
jgi:TonB-linked SusC/RagA family outer membrane protein